MLYSLVLFSPSLSRFGLDFVTPYLYTFLYRYAWSHKDGDSNDPEIADKLERYVPTSTDILNLPNSRTDHDGSGHIGTWQRYQ